MGSSIQGTVYEVELPYTLSLGEFSGDGWKGAPPRTVAGGGSPGDAATWECCRDDVRLGPRPMALGGSLWVC